MVCCFSGLVMFLLWPFWSIATRKKMIPHYKRVINIHITSWSASQYWNCNLYLYSLHVYHWSLITDSIPLLVGLFMLCWINTEWWFQQIKSSCKIWNIQYLSFKFLIFCLLLLSNKYITMLKLLWIPSYKNYQFLF